MVSKQKAAGRVSFGWRKKFAFAGVTTITFLGAFELVLALCGVEPLYLSRDRYVGSH
jgi:hypothetical protein